MNYVLFLEQNKWYIGFTELDSKKSDIRRDIEIRMTEHSEGNGTPWTKKYKPIQLMRLHTGTTLDADKLTLQYMLIYGWWNVRGGKWCLIDMFEPPIELLPNLLTDTTQQTYLHNINARLNTFPQVAPSVPTQITPSVSTQITTTTEINIDRSNRSTKITVRQSYQLSSPTQPVKCFRCGREHFVFPCKEKLHINGTPLT
jgi:hypothetical protein